MITITMKKILDIGRFFRREIKRYIISPNLRKKYMQNTTSMKKLNLGAGNTPLEGWLNVDLRPKRWDVAYMDVRNKFPFPNQSFNYILSEHLIEHLTPAEATNMLTELNRILVPGGKVRISTPDITFILKLYDQNGENQRYIHGITDRFLPDLSLGKDYRPLFVINNAFYNWGHRFLYDERLLREKMESAGFFSIKRFDYGKSNESAFNKVEMHENGIGDIKLSRIESLVLEGTK